MRLFHVRAKQGAAEKLMKKFATVSVDVVQGEPGNEGYFFGRGVAFDENTVVFASFWKDLAAIRQRFGENWQSSFLPEGYEQLIDTCWIQHIDVGAGWHVRLGECADWDPTSKREN